MVAFLDLITPTVLNVMNSLTKIICIFFIIACNADNETKDTDCATFEERRDVALYLNYWSYPAWNVLFGNSGDTISVSFQQCKFQVDTIIGNSNDYYSITLIPKMNGYRYLQTYLGQDRRYFLPTYLYDTCIDVYPSFVQYGTARLTLDSTFYGSNIQYYQRTDTFNAHKDFKALLQKFNYKNPSNMSWGNS